MKPKITHKSTKQNKTENTFTKKPDKIPQSLLWPILAGLFFLTFLLYSGTLHHGFVLDDSGVIKDNRLVHKGVAGIGEIFTTPYRFGSGMLDDHLYRPASLAMFAIEWQLFPGSSIPGHYMNVLLYALSAVLVFLVFRKLLFALHPIYPLLISLIWAAHPIHTEVVANIKSRDEIMSVLLLLISILTLITYFDKKKFAYLGYSLIAYTIALFSKEGVITALGIFPIIAYFYKRDAKPSSIFVTALYLLPALIFLAIRQLVLNAWATPATNTLLDNLLLAAPDFQSRLATAVLLLGKYLFILFFPVKLVSDYSYNQIPVTVWSDPYVLISLVIYISMMVYVIMKLRKRTLLAFGVLFFLLSISIYSNIFILIGSSFAERFMYLPSVGFSCFTVAFLMMIVNKNNYTPKALSFREALKTNKVIVFLISLILVLYTIQTVSRSYDWKDEFTLFSRDVKLSPNSAHMRLYWGTALRDKGNEEEDPQLKKQYMQLALDEFKQAVAIYPSYADSWHQIGLAYSRLGESEKSLEAYQMALKLNPAEPTTYGNMGFLFFQKGDYQKAIELYKHAIQLDSMYTDAYFNLGSSLGMTGNFKEAAHNFHKCLNLNPNNAKANYFLGITYRSMNDSIQAKKYLDIASALEAESKK